MEYERPHIGQQFGRLTITALPSPLLMRLKAEVACSCGRSKSVLLSSLIAGRTKSCGCLHNEQFGQASRTHGRTGSAEYRSWQMMKQRCTNPRFTSYPRYGARGITVCERWRTSFDAFLADMGPRPQGTSLDRWPDRNGNYEPGNCRWATRAEQRQNSDCTVLSPALVTQIRQSDVNCNRLAKVLGVNHSTVYNARAGATWANVAGDQRG